MLYLHIFTIVCPALRGQHAAMNSSKFIIEGNKIFLTYVLNISTIELNLN